MESGPDTEIVTESGDHVDLPSPAHPPGEPEGRSSRHEPPPPPPTTRLLASKRDTAAEIHGAFPIHSKAYGPESSGHSRTEFIFKVYDLLEKRLQFEAGWIGHRVAWLTASQSFLFAAYTSAALSTSPWSIPIRLIIILAALGTLVPTTFSIRAAMKVNKSLVCVRGSLDRELKKIGTDLGNGNALSQWVELGLHEGSPAAAGLGGSTKERKTYSRGGLAATCVPLVLGLAWFLLLLTFFPVIAGIVTERPPVPVSPQAGVTPWPDEATRMHAYYEGFCKRLNEAVRCLTR